MSQIEVHPQVTEALEAGRPVVGLESALITVGLPSTALGRPPHCNPPGWDAAAPTNLEAGRLLERTVRDAGALPATVAVLDGVLRIGLTDAQLLELAAVGRRKASTGNLASCLVCGLTAGTTVSATMLACGLPDAGPVRVLATGGIGGVHRHWQRRPDISTDLSQLAVTPVCVVSSGVKSILDVPATLQALEMLGVPVIAYGTERMPQFYSRPCDHLRAPGRLDDPTAVASLCRSHWETLGCRSGVVVANPVPEPYALENTLVDAIVTAAEAEAAAGQISAGEMTPYLLNVVNQRTRGRALESNIALLQSNARLAAMIASALAGRKAEDSTRSATETRDCQL